MNTMFWYGNLNTREQYEDLDRSIILKRVVEKQNGSVDLINLAQDRDQ
jgi:hypothetical protein